MMKCVGMFVVIRNHKTRIRRLMIRKNRAGILILTLLAAVVLGTVPALAKTIHEEVTVNTVIIISPAEESIISSAAAKVLRHIAKARGAIHNKDLEQAGKDLKKAHKLINIIKTSLPTTKVKDHISGR